MCQSCHRVMSCIFWDNSSLARTVLNAWKGVINSPLQSLVNQYFSLWEKYWLTKFEQLFSKKNHEKCSPHLKTTRNLGIFEISLGFSNPNELNPQREHTWITATLLVNVPWFWYFLAFWKSFQNQGALKTVLRPALNFIFTHSLYSPTRYFWESTITYSYTLTQYFYIHSYPLTHHFSESTTTREIRRGATIRLRQLML